MVFRMAPMSSRTRRAESTPTSSLVIDCSFFRPNVILVGTGSELYLCVDARAKLQAAGVHARVVSFPCWELFGKQSQEYKVRNSDDSRCSLLPDNRSQCSCLESRF